MIERATRHDEPALPTYELRHLAAAMAPVRGYAAIVHEHGVHLFRDGRAVEGMVPMELVRLADAALEHGEVSDEVEIDRVTVVFRCTRVRLAGQTVVAAVGDVAPGERTCAGDATTDVARGRAIDGEEHARRTPLTVIVGFCRTLRDHWRELDTDDVQVLLDGIDRQAQRLDATLARQELLGLRPEDVLRGEVDVDVLVRAAIGTVVAPGDERVIAEPSRLRASLDAGLFELLLVELVGNALQHGDPNGVEVVARGRAGTLEVSVDDDGVGIAEPEVAVLPFIGSDDGSTGGLGLALARRVAQLHGGDLEVHERPDGGTRVLAWFPDSLPHDDAA